jgi:hypothetical protein
MYRALLVLIGSLLATNVQAEAPAPIVYVDKASGCKINAFYPDADLDLHWSGRCVNGFADGPGVAEWQRGGAFYARFEGEMRAGFAEGRGLREFPDRRQEAEFRHGRMNGRCVAVTKAGLRVEAQCVDDLFNGHGKAFFADGGVYDGDFVDSHLTGKGVWVFANGSRLEGDFLDAKLNGKGRAIYSSGDSYEGDYVNGEYQGQGIWHDHDGTVYEGEWAHDLPNGRGVMHGTTHGFLGSSRHDFSGTWVNGCFRQGEYTATFATTRAACGFGNE